jgi:hypothetical protein
MTLQGIIEAITDKFECADPTNLTTSEINGIMIQLVSNCDNDIVNPDRATHPIVRG